MFFVFINISPRASVAPGPVTLIFTLSPSYVTKKQKKLTSKTTERFSYEYPETETKTKTKTKTKLIAAVTQDEEKYYKELEI